MRTSRPRGKLPVLAMVTALAAGCGGGESIEADPEPSPAAAAIPSGTPSSRSAAPDASASGPGQEPDERPSPDSSQAASPAGPKATPSRDATAGAKASDDEVTDLFLASQITSHAVGDGARVDCVADLDRLPAKFGAGPSVWLTGIRDGPDTLRVPFEVSLCIHGFPTDGILKVTASVGGLKYPTYVDLPNGPLEDVDAAPETLFVGSSVEMFTTAGGILQSRLWEFVPPPAVLEDLASTGRVSLRVEHTKELEDGVESVVAEHQQSVLMPTYRDRFILDEPRPGRRLAVVGFEPGLRVPIGLYRLDDAHGTGPLIRRIGIVVVPKSRVVVFDIPKDVLAQAEGDTRYCVTVPLPYPDEPEENCPPVWSDAAPSPPTR